MSGAIMSFDATIDFGVLGEQECEIEFDFTPGERSSWDSPGCEPEVCITSVKWRGIEIIDDIGDDAVEALEEDAFDHVEGCRIQAAEDRAEYLRDCREAA